MSVSPPFDSIKPHPLAIPDNRTGGNGINSGSLFICDISKRKGRLDEATQDGEAFVTWENGTYDTVKWNHLTPV